MTTQVVEIEMVADSSFALLAPDIQERVLLTPAVPGTRSVPEHRLRDLAGEPLWTVQRTLLTMMRTTQ
jgi:hypothetical protein